MKTRTSNRTVTFKCPFILAGLEEVLPAGDYSVETEEELIEGISYAAYRRTSTVLRLQARSGPSHLTRAMTVDPDELDAALERDLTIVQTPVGRDADGEKRAEETDRVR